MRIWELTESFDNQVNSEIIAQHISMNCQPFLSEIKVDTPPLYRGQSNGVNTVVNGLYFSSTKPNRNPKDTPIGDHKLIDQWFFDQFGIRFRSDHIMFATGHIMVGHYGKAHNVIPIGDFQFCWSPVINDVLNDIKPAMYEIHNEIGEKYRDKEKYPQSLIELRDIVKNEMILTRLERGKYQTTNLPDAIKSGNEVMIHCKEYFLLDVTDYEYKQIIKLAKEMI